MIASRPIGRGLALLLVVLATIACGAPAPTGAPAADQPVGDPAFQREWADLIAKARAEGELVGVIGAGAGTEEGEVWEEFGRRYGIKVTLTVGGGAELANRVIAERSQGLDLVDVNNLSTSGTERLLGAGGFYKPLMPEIIHPEVLDRSGFWTPEWPWQDNDGQYVTNYGITADINHTRLYYNTRNVPPGVADSLKSWNDLLGKGFRIVMIDPSEGDAGGAGRVRMWRPEGLGPTFLDRFLREPNLAVLPPSAIRQYVDGMARGQWDFGVLPGPAEGELTELRDIGLPVEEFPNTFAEGTSAATFGAHAIFARAPHPNAAKLFINWYLSREGGTVYNTCCARPGRAHLRKDVPQGAVDAGTWARLNSSRVEARGAEYNRADEESLRWFNQKFRELGLRP